MKVINQHILWIFVLQLYASFWKPCVLQFQAKFPLCSTTNKKQNQWGLEIFKQFFYSKWSLMKFCFVRCRFKHVNVFNQMMQKSKTIWRELEINHPNQKMEDFLDLRLNISDFVSGLSKVLLELSVSNSSLKPLSSASWLPIDFLIYLPGQ